jgi:hypothetical protein
VRKRRVRAWFARVVLGMMMGVVAFVVERRLLRAIKRGGKRGSLDDLMKPPATAEREGQDLSSPVKQQVDHQAERE